MNPRIASVLTGILLFGFGGVANAVLIDFDDGVASGTPVGAFYSGLGVTFSNAGFATFGSLPGGTPPDSILSECCFSFFTEAEAIIATFSFAVTSASITALDLGGNGFAIKAYDATVGGSLVDSDEIFGVGAGVGLFGTASVSGAGIRRLKFFQLLSSFGDGISLDNFEFSSASAAPEPTTLALLALGLAGVGFARKRRAQ